MLVSSLADKSLEEWSLAFERGLGGKDDPLDLLGCLVDVRMEIDIAVNIVAQGMNASMDTLAFPSVLRPPVVLSNTEHMRFSCAVLVHQIHFQLWDGLKSCGQHNTNEFSRSFIHSLQPWLRSQVLSIERFYYACFDDARCNSSILSLIDKKYTCTADLLKKSAFICDFQRATTHCGTLYHAAMHPGGFGQQLSPHCRGQVFCPRQPEVDDGTAASPSLRLQNVAWDFLLSPGLDLDGVGGYYFLCRSVPNLGVLFWDDERLADLDIVLPHNLVAIHAEMVKRLRNAAKGNGPFRDPLSPQTEQEKAFAQARQIIEWTRQPEQCGLEELLYRRTAFARMKEGRPLMKRFLIKPGNVCYVCGLDGHESRYCVDSDSDQ